jgi:hypothetical protein
MGLSFMAQDIDAGRAPWGILPGELLTDWD